jgi:cbb3-type cytochrome oxidase subunit 3
MRRFISSINAMLIGMFLLLGVFIFANPVPIYAYTCNDGKEFEYSFSGMSDADKRAERDAKCASHEGFGSISMGVGCDLDDSFLGLPTWYKYLESDEDSTGRCNPTIENTQAALPIGIAILEGMIRLAGLVAVVMIFIGGFRFITSQGNPESAKSARMTAINALIGLVIVMIATVVVSYIGRNIGA